MPTCHLDQRALISVAGAEAEHFLQNILTTDLAPIGHGDAWPGALLTPQGKILFDFLIARSGDEEWLIECRADIADDFVKRLTLYRLRAKAQIKKEEQSVVAVSWDGDSGASSDDSTVRDRRFPEAVGVTRHYGALPPADAPGERWDALRIAHAVAESGADYRLGEAFPHDVLFDQNGGAGLRKGCFVGQEVVSRMHHRGTARRRLLIAAADAPLPAPGTELTAGGRTVGTLGTVAGEAGLAIARIDRVKAAMDAAVPVMCGDAAVTLSIPAWAGFAFPEDGGGDAA